MKTVRVRIAVCVDYSGNWRVWHTTNNDSDEEILLVASGADAIYWITAENVPVPVPKAQEIAGTVEPVAEAGT